MLNVKKILELDENTKRDDKSNEELVKQGYDLVTRPSSYYNIDGIEYALLNGINAHILGSKQDIEGFENFIKTDEQKKKCPF